jgi:hypothetical protein
VIQPAVNLRGLITSLGAGGSLIAAALCAAALVGGILAVRGADGGAAQADTGDVTVPRAMTTTGRTAAPDRPIAREAPVAAVERAAPPRRRPTPRRRSRSTPVATPPVSDAPSSTPDEPGSTSEQTGTTGEGAGGGTGTAEPVPPPATGDEPRTVRRVAEQAREAVAPVVEAVPEPVQPTVDEVVATVEDVAGAVDDALAPVSGLLQR